MKKASIYYKQIDLSVQKSISSKKLKDLITTTIKWNLTLINDTEQECVIDSLRCDAHSLLLFGRYHLRLFTNQEYDCILYEITQAKNKRIEELRND